MIKSPISKLTRITGRFSTGWPQIMRSALLLCLGSVLFSTAGCYAVVVKHCDAEGNCTTFKSRKDHPNGIDVSYNTKTHDLIYRSGASITNQSDMALMLELVRTVKDAATPIYYPINDHQPVTPPGNQALLVTRGRPVVSNQEDQDP